MGAVEDEGDAAEVTTVGGALVEVAVASGDEDEVVALVPLDKDDEAIGADAGEALFSSKKGFSILNRGLSTPSLCTLSPSVSDLLLSAASTSTTSASTGSACPP